MGVGSWGVKGAGAEVRASAEYLPEDELTVFEFFEMFFESVSEGVCGGFSWAKGQVRLLCPGWWQILHLRDISLFGVLNLIITWPKNARDRE